MPIAGHSTLGSHIPSSTASTSFALSSPAPDTIALPTSLRSGLLHPSPSLPPRSSPSANQHCPLVDRDTNLGSPGSSAVKPPNSPPEHARTRPGSGSGPKANEEAIAYGNRRHTPSSRLGILRSHNRSSLSNQSQIQGALFRALHFQSSSSRSILSTDARTSILAFWVSNEG
jgi:hypothetical protein